MAAIDVGVVLAGGASERMGSDKADLMLGDETFLERAVGKLARHFLTVLVAGGDNAPEPSVLVADSQPGLGPLAGIAAALEHAGEDIFVMAVDTPLLSDEAIERLSGHQLLAGQVRVARVAGRIHPLTGCYPFDQLPAMLSRLATDDRSVFGFLQEVPHLTLIDIDDGSLADINTPTDYASIGDVS